MHILAKLAAIADQADLIGQEAAADQITNIMVSLAAPADMSKSEKKYWREAEEAAKQQYSSSKEPDKFYGTTTNIFKAKVKKHLGHNPFKKKKKKKTKK